MSAVLVTCGLVLAGVGTWTGYRHARAAIVPSAQPGDPTRSAIDAARPVHARIAVRRFARSVAASLIWLALALYGLFLAQTGAILAGLA